jgi:hypothetical protein
VPGGRVDPVEDQADLHIPKGCVLVQLETSASQPISRQPAQACQIRQPADVFSIGPAER